MALSAQNAIRDTVGRWLEGRSFTPEAGASSYTLDSVQARGPQPGATVTYPSAALLVAGTYENREPVEIPDTRDPDEGDGTYLQRTGSFDGELRIILYANDEDQEDELVAGVEQALVPDGASVPRITLTATGYYDQVVTVRRRELVPIRVQDTSERSVWRTAILCGVSIDVVRELDAADLQPEIGLTIDDGDEITIDAVDGTTDIP